MSDMTHAEIADLLKAIADPNRLRILGLLAGHARSGSELGAELGLGAPTISHHMDRLTRGGIVAVERVGQRRLYRLDDRALAAVQRLGAHVALEGEPPAIDERSSTLRNFLEGDRLKHIPAQRKKRVIVLQFFLERFSPSCTYSEREVNNLLRSAHPDVATLRRELVDYGFMTRESGIYRVAQQLPVRGAVVQQEISGDEHRWLRDFLQRTLAAD